jgi:hypothetical protein
MLNDEAGENAESLNRERLYTVNSPRPLLSIPKLPVTWLLSKYTFKSLSTLTLLGEQPTIKAKNAKPAVLTKIFIYKILAKLLKPTLIPLLKKNKLAAYAKHS